MRKLISLKKLISLSLVSALMACMMVNIFAATDANSTNVTNIYALWNDNNILGRNATANGYSSGTNGKLTAKNAGTIINGITMSDDYYYLEGNNTDTVRLIFGQSATTLVANSTGASKGDNYKGISALRTTLSNLSYTKNSTFTSSTISISKGTYTVGVGSGDYPYVLGFEIKFNNKSKNEAYAMYDLSVAGKAFKIVAHSTSNDTTDTSAADNDPDENGVIPLGGTDMKYANGTVIYQPTLKYMYDKGATYGIRMKNGVEFIVSKVAKATSDAGNLTLNYNIGKDAVLNDRYAEAAGGNVLSLDVISGFINEKIKYNIDLSNNDVTQSITDAQSDRWSDGRKVDIYVVNKSNLESASNATTTDGIIDNERMIVGSIIDGKVVFDVPAKFFDNTKEKLMIALKEIDIASLPAVPGVSITTDNTSLNEVEAPIIDTTSSTTVSEPIQLDTSAITSAPISNIDNANNINNANVNNANTTSIPNTGLKDNLILAAIAVIFTVSSTCIVLYKRKEDNA